MMNKDLFVIEPLENIGNSERPLIYMADRLRKKTLLIPEFQREYVWDDDKLKGWIETVKSREAIGVIVTYQLADEGNSPTYVADGLQRLTATNKFLDNPEKYGFNFGQDQAREYCERFMITVQHRHYQNHNDAMRAFQRLNSGTMLLPGEFYKGNLTLDGIGERLYQEIPRVVEMYETPFLERRDITYLKSRKKRLQAVRGALALFLQYMSGTDKLHYWNTTTGKINGMDVVEEKLIDYVTANKPDIDKEIRKFTEYTASHFATIESLMKETENERKPMSFTFSRYLFHMNIWRKNANRPVVQYRAFVNRLMKLLKPYPFFPSKFPLPDVNPPEIVGFKADNIGGSMKRLCEYFDMQDFYKGKDRPRRPSRPGYDVSHEMPFSQYGDGPTFLEPSQLNRARGAQPA